LSFGKAIPAPLVASAVSLFVDDVVTTTHAPHVASVGLPFVMVELRDRSALERAHANIAGFEAIEGEGVWPSIHLYVRTGDGVDLRARMFAPLAGVPEDPATGSANCALGGLLAHYDHQQSGSFSWRIAQGVEMGRPSVLVARAQKSAGVVESAWIGGASVLFSNGMLHLD
jgi:trans-2,3-dihydro-3-hydroxyanthranilate isomerase